MTQSRYRSLVFLTFALCCTSACIDLLVPSLLPAELLEAQKSLYSQWAGGHLVVITILSWTSSIAMLAAMYGLWSFSAWAPKFAILATVLLFFSVMQMGGLVQSGIAFAIHSASWLTWGAALLVPFLSPSKNWFKPASRSSAIAV